MGEVSIVEPLRKEWKERRAADLEAATVVADHFGIHPLVARILTTRNCSRLDAVEAFLQADSSSLFSPFLMHDMERAAKRIRQAIESGEAIVLIGDYDVDGVCSTALMMRTLRKLGANVDFIIPNRLTDCGYWKTGSVTRLM